MRLLNCIGLTVLLMITGCTSLPPLFSEEKPTVCDLPYTKYQATVTGYCQEPRAELLASVPTIEKAIELKPVEEIPEVFWFNEKLRYSLVKQESKAPMAFVIAGTGAKYNSPKMIDLQKVLFAQGYHVISLSSPTFANFIVNATTNQDIPGYLAKDAKTLYKVMQATLAQVVAEDNIEVSHFVLTGYSLGGAHSAFVAKLDEQEKAFNFQKVLLINPPVSLYNSVSILDSYLDIANDRENVFAMFDRVFDKFAESYGQQASSEFSTSSIYQLFSNANLSEQELKLLIGTSFRVSSTDMIFAIDASYNLGGVIYKNHKISKFESVTHSMKRAYDKTFTDYFEKAMVPWAQKQNASVTRDQLIYDFSLTALEGFIRNNDKISLITNADDIILAEGEVEYLRDIFADRAVIFDRGGHCGNMDRVSFVEQLKLTFNGVN